MRTAQTPRGCRTAGTDAFGAGGNRAGTDRWYRPPVKGSGNGHAERPVRGVTADCAGLGFNDSTTLDKGALWPTAAPPMP